MGINGRCAPIEAPVNAGSVYNRLRDVIEHDPDAKPMVTPSSPTSSVQTFSSIFSVADALNLDVFSGARVVAGHRGVHRAVHWVHNVGVPDAARWLNGGELVLTTAFNMPNKPLERETYLQSMIDKDVAAVGIAVGSFLEAIPENLRALANRHDFPLIEVPFQLQFVDIAREVNRIIAQRDVRHALEIHQSLTQLVVDGGGLPELAQTLAKLVRQSVSIENESFEAYASVNIAEVDAARVYTQQYGRTDPRLVEALETRGYLPDIHRTLRPVSLPKMPDVGLEMERILAPIVVHGEVIGYMWIIADDRPLADLERMAIESGATVAALMLLRQESVLREEASQRGDLISSLMQSDAANREDFLTDRALRYGLDLRQPFRVLLADSDQKLATAQYHQINRLMESLGTPILVGRFAGHLVLLAADAHTDFESVVNRIALVLGDHEPTLRVGISAAHRDARQVSQAHTECREALHIARRLSFAERTVYFDRLGYLHVLYRAGAEALRSSPYIDALKRLLDEHHADLFHTLEVYTDSGGSGVTTAERLHIHRSTLNYRLARIAEIVEVDLSDAATRTNLQVALKLMRLFLNV